MGSALMTIMRARTSWTLAAVCFACRRRSRHSGREKSPPDTTGLTAGEADDEPKRRRLFNLGDIDWAS